ncbi:hypothetical protein SMJ63A_80157 [Stenotrophomonas geniculata]
MREVVHAAIHRNHRTGDVAGQRRSQEGHQRRHFVRLAEAPDRNVACNELAPAFLGGMQAIKNLRAVDAPRCNRIHRNALPGHLRRQPLAPQMKRRLRRGGGIHRTWLHRTAEIDHPPPCLRLHAGQQRLGQPSCGGEVQGDRFLPDLVIGIHRGRPGAPCGIDQDVHALQCLPGCLRDGPDVVGDGDIADHDDRCRAAFGFDPRRQRLQGRALPRRDGDAHALGRQMPGDGGTDATARPRDQCGTACKIQVHGVLLSTWPANPALARHAV